MAHAFSRVYWIYFRCDFRIYPEQEVYVFKSSGFYIGYGKILVVTCVRIDCAFHNPVFLLACPFLTYIIIPNSGDIFYYFYKLFSKQEIRF